MTTSVRAGRRLYRVAAASFAVSLLLAACQPIQPEMGGEGTSPAPMATLAPAAEVTLPELTIDLTADGIVAPVELPAGPTRVMLVNSGGMMGEDGSPILPEVGRLVDGATVDDLMEALAAGVENPAPIFEVIKIFGYPFMGEAPMIWDLVPGNYVATTQDGSMMHEFTVVENVNVVGVEGDVLVELADFTFLMPDEIAAGVQRWELTNVGEQWHEIVVVKLSEGTTVDDLFAFFESAGPEEMPPFEPLFGYAPFSEGHRVWVDVELAPGEYTVLCFLPDLAGDMAPHAMHGMVRTLVVK